MIPLPDGWFVVQQQSSKGNRDMAFPTKIKQADFKS